MTIQRLLEETTRLREFPAARNGIFMAHAAVTALPRVAAEAIAEFAEKGAAGDQENQWSNERVGETRRSCATLLGCSANEIALLGPTALGLNLVANGLPWKPGDEVVFYQDDYPANVYPWLNLATRGVQPVRLEPGHPGVITWPVVEKALTRQTKLVALASCNFLSGYQIDIDEIGRHLADRNILFCVDGIQTLGAFPLSVKYVDFLSADSHKWMLGPCGAGLFYVKASRQELLQPTVLGSWNVVSPHFVAAEKISFFESSRRYEPGTFNLPGIIGMGAALKLLLDCGIEAIGHRILELRGHLIEAVHPLGFRPYLEPVEADMSDIARTGIVSLSHPSKDLKACHQQLTAAGITTSLRYSRDGRAWLRFSPHFYNTTAELDKAINILRVP